MQRYVPELPFPASSYVPKGPHPHPGHTRNVGIDVERLYRFGIDLFNHGYYWEAHEAWEQLWQAEGRTGAVADFFKGLIKLAAAGVKAREGVPAGVIGHARRAAELFASAFQTTGETRLRGLDLKALGQFAQAVAEAPPQQAYSRGASVVQVFDFRLSLQ